MQSYREWYSCDNIVRDTYPSVERDDHPLTGAAWLALLNPDGERTATVAITIYREDLQHEPEQQHVTVGPQRMERVALHHLPIAPRNQFFGVRVTSDLPILPQATQLEFRPWQLQPDAAISHTMYGGPLRATEWYFPDGWQGGGAGADMHWYERETLTLLNPGDRDAHVTLTFFSYGDTADVEVWVPACRLKVVALYDIPGLRYRWVEQFRTRMIDFSLRVRSDVPVVPQKTRRAYVQYEPSVQGMWSTFGHPYALHSKGAGEWYYPGGYVQDIGNYPRDDPQMLGWDLFFAFNPDPQRSVGCRATFCYEHDEAQTLQFDLAPHRQKSHWLHLPEHRHLPGVNRPYAVRVESDGPMVPHFLRAEYESWGWNNPTAMFGVVPYEGPLRDETTWYIPGGFWQDRADHPWVEQEWFAVYNPGAEDANITMTCLLDGKPREHYRRVQAGRVALLKMETLSVGPNGAHYGIKVAASQPVVVQQSRRTSMKGGMPSTLSTSATLGIPYPKAGS